MEHALSFGKSADQVGILSLPEARREGAPTVVLWNVGFNHRVAPNRLWVDLSRRLANVGIPTFRFDLSGLGDSAPTLELVGDLERAVLDLRHAVDWLTRNGHEHFVFVSNCSGTDNAHRVIVEDPRVVGAVFLDAYNYDTPKALIVRKAFRWFSLRRLQRRLRRKFPERYGISSDFKVIQEADAVYLREFPPKPAFEADLERLSQRNVQLLYIYSGETHYCYPEQFRDSLVRKELMERIFVEYFPEVDHLYSTTSARERLFSRVVPFIETIRT